MKLSIKNLKGEVFTIEVETTDKIVNLKEKIFVEKGLTVQSQKIVYKGKTVNNDDEIEKLGIKETDFLVVMTTVQKPQPKAKVEEKVEVPSQGKKEQVKEEEKKQGKEQEKKENTGSNQAEINELISMGFSREKCIEALRAAFNNTERAVEYLVNGIPANVRGHAHRQPGQGQGNLPSPPVAGSVAAGPLGMLAASPQFHQIRNILRANPAALQPILSQIASSSPQIYNLISQYPEQFERLIAQGGEVEGGQHQHQHQQAPPGTILVSPEQQQAINRLRSLGFNRIQAAQVYFACDKNEQLAANLLFDRLANGDIEMQVAQDNPPTGQNDKGKQGNKKSDDKGDKQGDKGDQDDNLFN